MNVQHKSFPAMGTRFDLVLPGLEAHPAEAVIRDIRSECERIEQLLSVYRHDSEVSRLNSFAGKGPVEVGEELMAILREAYEYHLRTEGYFDISLKAVSEFYRETGSESPEDMEFLRERSGMDKLEAGNGKVRFLSKEMKVDLGGYGKGYAMRQVLPILREHAVENALLSFGESLILGWGSHPYGDCWKVELPPLSGEGKGIIVSLHNEALSVSGNSLNNRKKFANSGHILNPHTLRLISPLGLVAVKSTDPVEGEVYSTALFSAGREQTEGMLKNAGGIEVHWSGGPEEA